MCLWCGHPAHKPYECTGKMGFSNQVVSLDACSCAGDKLDLEDLEEIGEMPDLDIYTELGYE